MRLWWIFIVLIASGTPAVGQPAWLGDWSGRASQAGAPPYDVELGLWFNVPGRVGGVSHYPQLKCGGTLTLQSADATRARYVERITDGSGCMSGGAVELVINPAGGLDWTWYDPGGNPGARATLTRATLSDEAQRRAAQHRGGGNVAAAVPPTPTPAPATAPTLAPDPTRAGEVATRATPASAASAPAKPAAPLALGLTASLEEEVESLSINLINLGCSLRNCTTECAADAAACPGGPKAALRRGVWSSCSQFGWKDDKNCRILRDQLGGEWSQSQPVTVPAGFEPLIEALREGRAFAPTRQNQAFVAGLGAYLNENCQLLAGAEEDTVRSYATAGVMGTMQREDRAGMQGSLQATMSHSQALQMGAELGRQLACRLPESHLLGRRIAASIRAGERGAPRDGSGGGTSAEPSVFVRTCTPQHGARACECLAGLGRASLADIHRRAYSREVVAEIIRRNPIAGLGVSMQCGITRY